MHHLEVSTPQFFIHCMLTGSGSLNLHQLEPSLLMVERCINISIKIRGQGSAYYCVNSVDQTLTKSTLGKKQFIWLTIADHSASLSELRIFFCPITNTRV